MYVKQMMFVMVLNVHGELKIHLHVSHFSLVHPYSTMPWKYNAVKIDQKMPIVMIGLIACQVQCRKEDRWLS